MSTENKKPKRRRFLRNFLKFGAVAGGVAGIAGVLLDELIESEQPLGSVTIPISTEASVLGNSATGSMFGSLFASDGGQGLEEDTQIRIGDAATFSRLRIRVTLNQLPRFC